ncbi:shikimate kinase [Lysobacter sp. GCM10012299]|jgi:shikimate kinase|uniref:shikimate kinase n=1 Tax=Lysobacter sp. GCM10012299 TaxID=3317333 RepID=UPI00361EC376
MNSASNLVLVGPMGAGKSCIGRALAERFSLRLVDVDHEIELRTGATISTIFECEGEAGFRARERSMLAELLADDGIVLSTGGGAVIDPDNRRQLRERGFVVHLHVSVERQIERLASDRSRPLLARGDREQVLHALAAEREPLYAQVADLRFDTNHYTATEVASRLAQELLQSDWQPQAPARVDTGLQRAHSKEPS